MRKFCCNPNQLPYLNLNRGNLGIGRFTFYVQLAARVRTRSLISAVRAIDRPTDPLSRLVHQQYGGRNGGRKVVEERAEETS